MVLALAVVLVGIGVLGVRQMPAEAFPDFTPPMVQVRTEALGLSAAEVEQLLTVPMEQEFFNGLPWLESVRSESLPGLSSVDMIFKPGTDVYRARQMVQERLTLAHALPNVSKPPLVLQPLSSTSRVVMVGLSSTSLSPIEMSVLARWKIKPRLTGVPGVANVAIWGMRERQLQVQVDPERLNKNGVSLDQVIRSTGNALWSSPLTYVEASTPGAGGFIDTTNQRLGIQHISPIKSAENLAQVAIVDDQGRRLRLSDVAQVVEDHQPLIGDAVLQDGPGLLLVVERFPGASTMDVTRGVEQALESMRSGLTGLEYDTTIYRPATFFQAAFDNLTTSLLLGLLFLALVIGAFFFDWRAALISVVAIALSFLAALLVLYLLGATLNLLVVAGLVLALAVVVDDAIVDVENVRRRLRQRHLEGRQDSRFEVAVEAAAEMRGALVYPTLIILASALPLLFVGAVTGAFLRPLALAYAVAVVASTVVALTATPALAVTLLSRGPQERRESPVARRLGRGYGALLTRSVGRPLWTYVAAGFVVLLGFALLPLLRGQTLTPVLQDRDLLVQLEGAPGASLPDMNRIAAAASRDLRSIPGVRNVGAHVGRAVTSDRSVGVNSGELWVSLDPQADYGATVAAIRTSMDGYPGLRHDVLTYPDQRVRTIRAGTKEALVVRIYGRDLQVLREKSAEVRQILSEIDGVVDPRVDLQSEEPTVEIEVKVPVAQRQGLKPGDIKRAAATLLAGIEAGSLFEEQKVFEVVVKGVPETRRNVSSIPNLLLDTPGGGLVRLGDVADVRIRANPQAIRHEGAARLVDVLAGVRGRSLGSVTADVESRLRQVTFPQEHHAEILGPLARERTSQQLTVFLTGAAVLLMLLFLQAAFGSWRIAAIFLLALPVAAAGAVAVAVLRGDSTSLVSLSGILVVLGIAARQGVVLVTHYQRLEREGAALDRELVLGGSRDRFVPVVMTALTTGLALLPLVMFGSISGQEIVQPLATIILGGLVTSTLLTLFLTPSLYLRFATRALPEPPGQPADAPGAAAT